MRTWLASALVCLGCASPREAPRAPEGSTVRAQRFPGFSDEELAAVDRALAARGNLGVYGDFSAPLEVQQREHLVTLERVGAKLRLGIFPRRGGWEFGATVDPATSALEDPVVATEAPAPR